MEIKEIQNLYNKLFGCVPLRVEKLPGAGSSRRYFRVYAPASASPDIPATVIATVGDDVRENESFCLLADRFAQGADAPRLPRILAVSDDMHCYLQSDHGDIQLMSLIDSNGEGAAPIIERGIRELVRMQTAEDVDFDSCALHTPFCRRQIMWDLNYFKYEFLKPSGIDFNEGLLEDDFESFACILADYPASLSGFMYRDFQSRNVMVEDDGVTLIDFQGGRRGPIVYDIVSLLWQAKAGFSDDFRRKMLDFYVRELSAKRGADVASDIERVLPGMLLFRTLQVLGAYGFRGLVEKKSHFIESIPKALKNLGDIYSSYGLDDYPELKRVSGELIESASRYGVPDRGRLCVEVFSFSYKRGYPEDFSGNGGGFMFDCRGMHNPGRYDEYKSLTGLDVPVIDFLEERGEVQEFLKNAYGIVDHSVAVYSRRGFRNLQMGFGCTGGRHRSVYCAQHMAEHLAEKFPEVEVLLKHREQGISKRFVKGEILEIS